MYFSCEFCLFLSENLYTFTIVLYKKETSVKLSNFLEEGETSKEKNVNNFWPKENVLFLLHYVLYNIYFLPRAAAVSVSIYFFCYSSFGVQRLWTAYKSENHRIDLRGYYEEYWGKK